MNEASKPGCDPEIAAALDRAARGLRASREFINALPLTDGASRRAIDREIIAIKLIPDGLMAIKEIAEFLDLSPGLHSEFHSDFTDSGGDPRPRLYP